ncbi:SDR family oxidoreductase [Paenibacillus sp. Leaf72]|uniref:SDR family oxidoreductase n=1 Tax=Paenibacillus sp. Leaf72 TaxID=1736234 RepID=UPI0006FC9AF3|nr:SDR family NAD(P)-dependent oxidoreductase [Paenibacillus sp. Leaf72]KQO15806.1 3-ketoacyl-ACP reductase [Paenibacillus sp. Leaf72]
MANEQTRTGNGRLAGKAALITGAGSGIGRAAALLFAKEGANLALLDVNEDGLAKVKQEAEAFGVTCATAVTDISSEEAIEAAYKLALDKLGQLDIVYANAGINGSMAPIELMKLEDWSKTININLNGTFLTVKHAIPALKEKGGSILITSSINGNRVFSNIGFSAYSSTKAAQVAFTQMAALELANYRIRVNAICPGSIKTNIDKSTKRSPYLEEVQIPVNFPEGDQPLEKGPGSPEQVAQLALFLGSDDSYHITGTTVYIDGAESLLHG